MATAFILSQWVIGCHVYSLLMAVGIRSGRLLSQIVSRLVPPLIAMPRNILHVHVPSLLLGDADDVLEEVLVLHINIPTLPLPVL